jgi:hypothetical protein
MRRRARRGRKAPWKSALSRLLTALFCMTSASVLASRAFCAVAGAQGATPPLFIVDKGKSDAVIVQSPQAGPHERRAAGDLAKYIKMMTGVAVPIADTAEARDAALASGGPLLLLGKAALAAKPQLAGHLQSLLKKQPFLRADGIILSREGNKVYLAGSNDESHYFAAAELLRGWGVRWFMPGAFGECVPEETSLAVGDLDLAHAPPFEVRTFAVAWLGGAAGAEEFQLRNMMIDSKSVPVAGHALGRYTKGLAESPFEVPLTDPNTMNQVAEKADSAYAEGKAISLAMEDGLYGSSYPRDKELMALQWDKYSLRWAVTDAMLELLNGVARRLHERRPASTAKIGFLIYSNMLLPPKRDIALEPALYGLLAPIDIDPSHAMGDLQSPPKNEYREILEKWVKLTQGRLMIYDYDQSMLVWRDLPNPSHLAFRDDVKRYRDAGLLGFVTETRMALATTGINLYLRGRLMWDPDDDVDALLEDFYAKFFGPAQAPMRAYWSAIFDAWRNTRVTEHEYFVAPAIFTPALVERLGALLLQAEEAAADLRAPQRLLSRNEALYLERLKFVRLGYETLKSYMAMVKAGATEAAYPAAVAAGETGLRARDALTRMDPAFTTTRLESGPAFWPGEVEQYRDLRTLVDGEKGRLIAELPLEWSFRRDKDASGIARGFLNEPIDLTFWRAHKDEYAGDSRKDYPSDHWEMARTDLYVQAQGVRDPDRQSFTGDLWYRTEFDLSPDQRAAKPHIHFPGLFNNCELYVNGQKVGSREQKELWWLNDYRFEWDLPLGAAARAGMNALALRCHNPHHMGGMFRRPFIYAPVGGSSP